MADTKISALAAASALAGTEVVPIVQGGITKKASITQILKPAAGQGIDFSANTPASGKTSQLLNWYEEGTYTAAITCGTSGTVTLAAANDTLAYTRIGRQVTVQGYLAVDSVSSPTGYFAISLPFAIGNLSKGSGQCGGAFVVNNTVLSSVGDFSYIGVEGQSSMWVFLNTLTNLSAASAQQLKAGSEMYVTMTYFV